MPPVRSLKRPGDGGDSSTSLADDALAGSPKVKLPRLDRGSEDFSSVVKTKLSSYTRTGQACDRCKVCIVPSLLSPLPTQRGANVCLSRA